MPDEKPQTLHSAGDPRCAPPSTAAPANLPAIVPQPVSVPARRRQWRSAGLILLLLAAVGGGGIYWRRHAQTGLPPGIAWSNGRLEADEIDIDTKFAGRIAKLFVDEGDMVAPGQVVAMMDTQDLAASLKKSQALADQAQHAQDEAEANLTQQQSQVTLAKQELDRAATLAPRGLPPSSSSTSGASRFVPVGHLPGFANGRRRSVF